MQTTIKTLLGATFLAALAAAPGTAIAQDGKSLFGMRTASVTFGPYARVELGQAMPSLGGGYWQPPGPSDPTINFDVQADKDRLGYGAIALGYDWQTGVRGDIAIFGTGKTALSAPCSSASDGSPCSTHSAITEASIRTTGAMANVFYAPLEARGSNSIFQPFIVGGVGIARNTVGDWTRVKNPDNPTVGSGTSRTFKGDTTSGIAWSVGIGASLQLTPPGRWPVILEASWRYYDYGSASGSSVPVTSGSQPIEPFTFDNKGQIVTLGVRVPLKRF